MASFSHYVVKNGHQVPELSASHNGEPTGTFLEQLNRNLKVEITNLTDTDIEFDLIGVDASIANALRRILLAEVPTIAIEHVWIAVNSSIIQDEVLAHRVGLIPIRADARKLDYVIGDEETDKDTIVFHFDVECTAAIVNGSEQIINGSALSGAMKWLPQGSQNEVFPEGVAPVHDDIVVAKLKPGQRIEFEAHCRKGVGKDHTKYSPVATASYRLLPEIILKEPVTGALAYELKNMCPMNVFDIEDLGSSEATAKKGKGTKSVKPSASSSAEGQSPTARAVVARPRDCTMCRECVRHVDRGWDQRVVLKRRADHFLFSVESVGSMAPETVVREAISILKAKALKFLNLIDDYEMQM